MTNKLRNGFRNRHLLLLDLALLPVVTLLAYVVRFEGASWPAGYAAGALVYIPLSLGIKLAVVFLCGLYRRLWRFASILELETILLATAVSGALSVLLGAWLLPALGLIAPRVPLSVLAMDILLSAGVIALPRLLVRSFRWHQDHGERSEEKKVLIAGAHADRAGRRAA
jgi:FlaA1/EpsC-like NDP-sugar epimerase